MIAKLSTYAFINPVIMLLKATSMSIESRGQVISLVFIAFATMQLSSGDICCCIVHRKYEKEQR